LTVFGRRRSEGEEIVAPQDAQTIKFIWPEDGVGPLTVIFEFVASDSGWDCARIAIEPLWEGVTIDPADLRAVPLTRLLRQGRAGIWSQRIVEARLLAEAQIVQGVPPDQIAWPPRIRKDGRVGRRGAPGLSQAHMARVAEVYNAAEADKSTGRKRPVLAVMAEFGMVRSTAVKQIRRCRDAGLIGPAPNRGNSRKS
jgi:hypothetical protein